MTSRPKWNCAVDRQPSAGLRQIMSRFVTGVTVVTISGPEGPHGTTVNSFTSVSLDPALVLVCLKNDSSTARLIEQVGSYAINILSHAQQDLGTHFARGDRYGKAGIFEQISQPSDVTGSPLLDGAVAHIDCRLSDVLPGGDHTIFIGEVVDLAEGADHTPLAFHRGQFLRLAS
jgi:flavin reductase (DIM6/NTAB) family NADH-FMN oxidoreductase RutF